MFESENRFSLASRQGMLKSGCFFVALMAMLLLAFDCPVMTKHAYYFMADHCFYFQPFATYIGERLRAGEWAE